MIAQFLLPDTTEIQSWIMSFGPRAKALEPQSLINDIATDLTAMQQTYDEVST
ncbi:MAG: hypothetical protein Fues2KO_02300 [Fuerstiella sp.]